MNPSGFTGGAQTGYNWQFNNWLAGLEGDINYLGLHNSFTNQTPLAARTGNDDLQSSFLATFRGRLGVTVDRLLLYGTAGGAYANFKTSFNGSICAAAANCAIWSASNQSNDIGFVYGGGAEFAYMNGWTFKIEYLHAEFPSQNITAVGSGPLIVQPSACVNCTVTLHTSSLSLDLVRAGFNYKFGN